MRINSSAKRINKERKVHKRLLAKYQSLVYEAIGRDTLNTKVINADDGLMVYFRFLGKFFQFKLTECFRRTSGWRNVSSSLGFGFGYSKLEKFGKTLVTW